MSIDNPVGGHSQDPYEPYRIYGEQQNREQGSGKRPPNKRPHLVSQILSLIKKTLESMLKSSKKNVHGKRKGSLQENLLQFKAALDTLKKTDFSQDVTFLNHLSEIWHHVLEDGLRFTTSDPFFVPFQSFLSELQNYPPSDEHPFAYYLTEYTGHMWLPFPYMELVRNLHQNYQNHPKTSLLERWTQLLDELMTILSM